MARVFLSYDREDRTKAQAIAKALERAGHFAWWDLHIKGGAEYGLEIEKALEQSDAIVVLWSAHSINSTWVRDEAASGRDSGRLIPVMIDLVSPPMGFRQYQNLEFSSWKGRGKPPRMAELLASIDALGERESSSGPVKPVRGSSGLADHRQAIPSLNWWWIVAGLFVLLGLAIARPWEVPL